ncbi:STAS domain-containing protein [Falsibacillus pallidus]|uniref:Anti-anti-sigma regulatory factor n=1 Tax=Falsibacillus pallidus TaxID=493781 RepID=A0A370GPJ0_9BACI|nr:STAS domain-containing protein [Falsibacillus pallidus]RDI45645.1 anti-anti-sigma regulatory factor [Falsibacillus pallidus]
MNATFQNCANISQFIIENRGKFQEKLLSEAVNVASKINEILLKGNIDLLKNAETLALNVIEERDAELAAFARQEGIAWAQHNLTLAFKLEWVQAIRRTLWEFNYKWETLNDIVPTQEEFYALEKKINDGIDDFLNGFFLNYSTYKDEMINEQRKLVEHLSVPIIPVSPTVAVLPLIGSIDTYRMQTIEEKALMDISAQQVQTLVIDLSGVADMELDVMDHFQKVLTGVNMMGCKAIISGMRPELTRKMVHAGITFDKKAETKGTLQETLRLYLS